MNADNSFLVDRASTRTGTLAGNSRNRYRNKGKQETEKEITIILTNEFNTAQLKDYEFKGLDTLDGTFYYRFSFILPARASEIGGLKIFKLCWTDKFGSNEALSYEKRLFSYDYYPGTDTVKEETTITIPDGYRPVDLVPITKLTSPFGDYLLTLNYSKGVIYGKRQFIDKKKVILPTEYKDFKAFYEKILKEDDKEIALKKGKQ